MKLQICVIVFLHFVCVTQVWSVCPQLDANVRNGKILKLPLLTLNTIESLAIYILIVLCTNSPTQNVAGSKYFKCGTRNKSASEIQAGTITIYQCNKHYKPTSRIFNGGRLQCAENGVWANYPAFKKFRCELDCGKRPAFYNQLISSGNATSAKHWPWVATIFRQTSKGEFKYSCGGSLIGLRTIITSAHCLADNYKNKYPKEKLRIVFGSVSSNFVENVNEGASVHLVQDFFLHPDYYPESLISDIAVIQLIKPVTLTESAFPICLPLSFEHDALVLSAGNTSFGTDGSGLPARTLQYGQIPIISVGACNDKIKLIPRSDQFCGGNSNNGPNICKGDSGSGLVFKSSEFHENTYVIHGIVSNTGELSNGCAPVVLFAKVFNYIRWIQEKLIISESPTEDATRIQFSDTSKNKAARPAPIISPPPKGSRQEEYTLAERSALVLFRPLVKGILLEDYMYEDSYLIKYLRAKNLNMKDTVDMLQATMKWRRENRMNEITNEDFTKFQKVFTIFFQGYDKEGRPVYTTVVRLIDVNKMIETGEIDQFKRYLVRNLEETAENIREIGRKNITQCIGVFDVAGVDRHKHLCFQCLNIIAYFVRTYETYYPQQNYITYVINMPVMAAQALDTIRPLMSEHTTRIVKIYGSDKKEWSKELLKQIPRNQLFPRYGGTKVVRRGTNRVQLAL